MEATAAENILEIRDLTKRFPGVLANDQVSLDVRKGEILALLGENGAGKSTLAECIFGFYQADEGEILLHGEVVDLATPSDAIKHRIGMVHQHFLLVDPFTAVENIVLGTAGLGAVVNLREAQKRIQALCDEYDLSLDLNAKVWQLCVGEQQWVEILKALYVGIDLLILDEPTAVLTPQETDKLFAVLNRMKAEGLAIIFITHKLREVMEVSDRVTVLRKGKKIGTVDTAEVTKRDLARMMVGREVLFRVEKEECERGDEVLSVKNLQVKDDRGQEAVKDVSFALYEGEILGLAGVAGNGQKELFETLVGARKAGAGEVVLQGENIVNKTPAEIMQRGMRHIPEDRIKSGLVLGFKVAENLFIGRQRSSTFRRGPFLDGKAIQAYSKGRVEEFEVVTPSVNHLTKNLSGGNQQKLILARELDGSPPVLLAAQPTRGLDVGVVEYVHRQLLEKRGQGMAILLATEDLDELFMLADRIAVIYQGEIMGILDAADANLEEVGLLMAGC